jgi:biopolymer transport protein ExbD
MILRRRKKNKYDDSSALSDLAFLLIIYFIVIAGFNVNKGFLMNLPAKDSTRTVLREELLRFELSDGGELLFGQEIVDFSFAQKEIAAGIAARPNLAVSLVVSPKCAWQYVVSFVEMAESFHVESFSFTMKKEESP